MSAALHCPFCLSVERPDVHTATSANGRDRARERITRAARQAAMGVTDDAQVFPPAFDIERLPTGGYSVVTRRRPVGGVEIEGFGYVTITPRGSRLLRDVAS